MVPQWTDLSPIETGKRNKAKLLFFQRPRYETFISTPLLQLNVEPRICLGSEEGSRKPTGMSRPPKTSSRGKHYHSWACGSKGGNRKLLSWRRASLGRSCSPRGTSYCQRTAWSQEGCMQETPLSLLPTSDHVPLAKPIQGPASSEAWAL